MLKLIAHGLLSFVFVLVMTMQVVPHASAMPSDTSMSMDGMDMSNAIHSGAPCKGMTPACIDSMGCATIAALPTTPLLTSAPLQWDRTQLRFVDVAIERPDNPARTPFPLSFAPENQPPPLRPVVARA